MKILWNSPMHPTSAIARFSRLVTGALRAAGHEIRFERAEKPEWQDAALSGMTAQPGSDEFSPDIAVYNVGNFDGFHASGVTAMRRRRGVLILHDAYVLQLFLRLHADQPELANGLLDEIHGAGAADAIRKVEANRDFVAATANFPMSAWLAREADGAIAHSRFYEPGLRTSCAGPVAVIPMAYDAKVAASPLDVRDQRAGFRILTFGHINPNRRVESVLRAIGGSEVLRARATYRVVGPIHEDERRRLENAAREVGVTSVAFAGPVTDDELVRQLSACDVVCGLRRPVTEGASASAIETMLSGRPLIVSEGGFYDDLPDEFVFRVRAEQEVADLQRHLLDVMENAGAAAAKSGLAAAWARGQFSAEAYAARLIPFLERVVRVQPRLSAARQVAASLTDLGIPAGDPLVARVAAAMEEALPGSPGETDCT